MKKTIYLHCGIPKTGSTSIQNYLSDNEEKNASELGIYYLKTGRFFEPNINMIRKNHSYLCRLFFKENNEIYQYLETLNLIKNLTHEIEKVNYSKIIISSEHLIRFTKLDSSKISILMDALKNHEIKMIIYLRRQDDLILSCYNQIVKDYYHKSIIEFYHEYIWLFDFNQLLIKIQKLFRLNKEKIIIRPFEIEQLKDRNIVSDFLSIFDIDKKIDNQVFNPSWVRDLLEFKKIINAEFPDSLLKRNFYLSKLEKLNQKLISQKQNIYKEILSPKERYDFMQTYFISNEMVAKKYLNLSNGKLFIEEACDPSEPFDEYPGLSNKKFFEILFQFR